MGGQLLDKRWVLRAGGAVGATTRGLLMWRMLGALVIAVMLGNWTWVLFAPRSAAVLPTAQPASNSETGNIFGVVVAPSAIAQVALPNVRLLGVFAGTPGFAILELDGNRQAGFAAGEEIVAGAKLVKLAIDHVLIERGGVQQQIPLEGNATAIKSAAAALAQPTAQR